jgi:hypothetical protein
MSGMQDPPKQFQNITKRKKLQILSRRIEGELKGHQPISSGWGSIPCGSPRDLIFVMGEAPFDIVGSLWH